MTENSDKQEDIFDNIDSESSDIDDNIEKHRNMQNNDLDFQNDHPNQRSKKFQIHLSTHLENSTNIISSTPPAIKQKLLAEQTPLPMIGGPVSLASDMKFGWKPEVDFESAPIPLYFNFIEHPMQTYYEEQAYYQNSNSYSSGSTYPFKIIYYGPRFKDSFEMHKNFVKSSDNTYDFNFPKFYGIASAKAYYDSVFEDMMDGEAPRRDEMREFIGMSPDIAWNELTFNSNFENGNLDMVVKTGEHTYDLFLRVDTNTRGHFNWFHFEVGRTKKGRTVTFNIVNMSKRDSLYNHGQQINYWSQKKNVPSFCGWQKGGVNIKYGRSKVSKEHSKGGRKKYYCLSFEFTFEHDNDKIWFANTIPYTYSMAVQYIKSIVQEQKNHLEQDRLNQYDSEYKKRGKYLQESVLCKSLGGVEVPLLTITNFNDYNWQKKKKVVFVQARIHPGETASSWIAHGLITFLISRSKVAVELRKRLVFKIIPMCNPDGVIIGNTRTTLIGRDMNRQYAQSEEEEDPKLNPIPIAIKNLIQSLIKEDNNKILSFWDLHQHSKKKSIFIYGPYYPLHNDKYLKIRIIPKLLSESSEMFRFFSCKFRIEKYKENCARITIGKMFNISNCFTLECSSYGYLTKDRETIQFSEQDLIEFGKNLAESILEYCLILERDKKIKEEIKERIKEKKKKRKPFIKDMIKEDKPLDKSPKKKGDRTGQIEGQVSEAESNLESDEVDSNDDESSDEPENFNEQFIRSQKADKSAKYGNENSEKRRKESGDKDSINDDDDEDRFYSDEEEGGNAMSGSPVSRPSDIKGLLKHKQKKSKFDVKAYTAEKKQNSAYGGKFQPRTLESLFQMIQNDIIHEEKFENDSNASIGSSSSGTSQSEDDDLDFQDQQILKDRILNAIKVFSKWSPNPKKEILQNKRRAKLSIENRSIASSKKSKGSDSKRSSVSGVAALENELSFPIQKFDQQRSTPISPIRMKKGGKNQAQKEVIDNFLKEFGLSQNASVSSKLFNNLSLIGNKITNNQLNEIDDEVLSTISNELIKHRKKKMKSQVKKGKKDSSGDLLLVKSFGMGKQAAKQSNWLGPFIENISNGGSGANGVVVGSARKVILQKYFQNNTVNKGVPGTDTSAAGSPQQNNRGQFVFNQGDAQQQPFIKPPATQKILNIGFSDQPSQPSGNTFQIKYNNILDKPNNQLEKKESQKVRFQQDEEPAKNNSHLLGYDNKIALLNQAIMHKKQLSFKHPKKEQQVVQTNEVQRAIHLNKPKSLNRTGGHQQHQQQQQYNVLHGHPPPTVKIPSAQPVLLQHQNNSHNAMNQSFYNNNNQSHQSKHIQNSFDHQQNSSIVINGSMPPPFISCQIHPIPKQQSNVNKHRRNVSFQEKLLNQGSLKVNAATDTNNVDIKSILLSKTNENHEDHNKSVLESSRQDGVMRSQGSLTDPSVINLHSHHIYDQHQRQILSSQSKANQLQLDYIRSQVQHASIQFQNAQSKKEENNKVQQQQNKKQQQQFNSLYEEIERTHQISLQQWQVLAEKGLLPEQKMLMVNSTNQQLHYPNTQLNYGAGLQVNHSQQVSTHTTSKRSSFTSSPRQQYYSSSNAQQFSESYAKDATAKYINQYKSEIQQNQQRPSTSTMIIRNNQISNKGKINRGRANSQTEPYYNDQDFNDPNLVAAFFKEAQFISQNQGNGLLIKNELEKSNNSRLKTKPVVSNIMEYVMANKERIVREVILNSGGKLLGRPQSKNSNNNNSKQIPYDGVGDYDYLKLNEPKIKLDLNLSGAKY